MYIVKIISELDLYRLTVSPATRQAETNFGVRKQETISVSPLLVRQRGREGCDQASAGGLLTLLSLYTNTGAR